MNRGRALPSRDPPQSPQSRNQQILGLRLRYLVPAQLQKVSIVDGPIHCLFRPVYDAEVSRACHLTPVLNASGEET